MRRVYLDYAAATPMLPAVKAAMEPYFSDRFYNPSATYLAARAVRGEVESFRARVAARLGARPAEIIFTAGGTEANNLAIKGVMARRPDCRVAVSAIEHESVLAPAQDCRHVMVGVDAEGLLRLDKLKAAISDETALVSVIYASNEIGVVQPIRDVARLVRSVVADRRSRGLDQPLYLHTDACQAANYLDLSVSRLGVDLMTINAGKIYGPKQCGALYVKTGVRLRPLIQGGGQEAGRRSGTESPANLAGLAEALDRAQTDRQAETDRLMALRRQFIEGLKRIDGVSLNGSLRHRLPNNVHASFRGHDNERLMMLLDEAGIQVAVGSACAAAKDEPSHVLTAIGLSEDDARASLRFSMGRFTTAADVQRTIKALTSLVAGA